MLSNQGGDRGAKGAAWRGSAASAPHANANRQHRGAEDRRFAVAPDGQRATDRAGRRAGGASRGAPGLTSAVRDCHRMKR